MTSLKHPIAIAVAALAVSLAARPAHGQLVVNDPLNTAQAILLVQKTINEYQTLVQQYQTIVRMSQSLQNMARYRTVPIPFSSHDPSRFPYGAPWLTALNSGDARGDLYAQIARTVQRPGTAALARLPPDARRAIEDAYATIEITDSIAQRGAHQVALVRGYGGSLQSVVQLLENDILSPVSALHQLTAILDKVAAGELVGRRQDTASNQLLSHALEQLLAQAKRRRDTEVATMNMRLVAMQRGRDVGRSYVEGSAEAFRTWRQP
jgi:hypothetical protein